MKLERPDTTGRFGDYGGTFAPETLMPALIELEEAFAEAWADETFHAELRSLLRHYVGRPTPVYRASRLSDRLGIDLWCKREDLAHTGAHKINNTVGQGLLARRMGKPRVIAETGAGQHGVATATACALFGLECEVYMGEKDIERQALNVYRMQMLGAKVTPSRQVRERSRMRYPQHCAIGLHRSNRPTTSLAPSLAPIPFPYMVREFQKVIGEELKEQMDGVNAPRPDVIVAPVGGGSNAMGIFYPYAGDDGVDLVGSRSSRSWHLVRQAWSIARRGIPGGSARSDDLHAPGHLWASARSTLGIGRPRLSGRRPRARLLQGHRACPIRERLGRRGHRGLPPHGPDRRDHPCARVRPRLGMDHPEAASLAGKTVVLNLSGRGDKDVQQVAAFHG